MMKMILTPKGKENNMKKNGIILIFLAVLILVSSICIYFWPVKVETFSVDDHQERIDWYLENVEYWDERPDTYEISPIKNGRDAKWTALKIWHKIYGWEILSEMPYNVFYDEVNDAWYVEGSLLEGLAGGTAFLIITSEGKIVAVGHGK